MLMRCMKKIMKCALLADRFKCRKICVYDTPNTAPYLHILSSLHSPLAVHLKSMAFQFSHCMRSTFELMRSQSLLCLLCMTSRRRFGNFSRFFFRSHFHRQLSTTTCFVWLDKQYRCLFLFFYSSCVLFQFGFINCMRHFVVIHQNGTAMALHTHFPCALLSNSAWLALKHSNGELNDREQLRPTFHCICKCDAIILYYIYILYSFVIERRRRRRRHLDLCQRAKCISSSLERTAFSSSCFVIAATAN